MDKKLMSVALAPRGSIEAYIQTVSNISMLTEEEEKSLALLWWQHGDLSAARQMVMSHLRFVVHIARSYSGYGLPQSDLIQEGNVGLMKAVKRFDPSRGVRLVSFAVHWIKAEIHEYVLRNWRMVKIATTKAQRKMFFNLRKSKKRLGWFSQDEISSVAHELGVSPREVLEMESRMAAQDQAFDATSNDDQDDRHMPVRHLEDKFSDIARAVEEDNWELHATNRLSAALDMLDNRSRHIVTRRWLDEKKATLQELADDYQVSAERIRQLEKNAMKKLRQSMLL